MKTALTLGPTTGNYTPAVRVGDLWYLSGQAAFDEAGGVVPGGIREQTAATLENTRTLLSAAGLTLGDLVSVTVYLTSMADWAGMNEVYGSFFPEGTILPARTAVAVSGLAEGLLVEMTCIADASGQGGGAA
ncbi:reactive intermediate/imine deaminase [Subtercola sp. Z020]|uniref:RidA family protein n=1 Tax=Subtercola sp. Z020 TaxID=2080582 RepID=UPI000CE7E023|nr:RidA family protein [Subtercola sp. Z020]PPF88290.1 reactive intermediate/imine deaminase [Subtercola sp. Z020]